MGKKIVALLIGLVFVLGAVAFSDDLTGRQIIEKMRDRSDAKTSLMRVKMVITSKSGSERVRVIRNRMKDTPNGGKTVISFEKPDDVKGTKFLVNENKKGDDEQLLFLPAVGSVKRITSKGKKNSFMGTDFTYADMQSHDPDMGTHKRLDDAQVDGHDCYCVETTPSNPDEYGYSKIVFYTRKDNFIPIKGEFYDKAGKLLKIMTVSGVEKDEKGNWMMKDTLMKNVQKGSSTKLTVLQQKNDIPIADEFFSERFLTDQTRL